MTVTNLFVVECICKVIVVFFFCFILSDLELWVLLSLSFFFLECVLPLTLPRPLVSHIFGVAKGLEFATQIIGINRLANHCICSPSICVSQYLGRRRREKKKSLKRIRSPIKSLSFNKQLSLFTREGIQRGLLGTHCLVK